MLWVALYLIVFLVTAPVLGRMCAKGYEETPRKSTEISPLSFAISYGLMWPLTLASFLFYQANEGRKKIPTGRVGPFFRRVFTGTDKTYKPLDRVGTTY